MKLPRIALATTCVLLVSACNIGGLGSNPSCSDFSNASASDQLKAAQSLAKSKGDTSSGQITMLSARAYCAIYPNGHIDGIYHG